MVELGVNDGLSAVTLAVDLGTLNFLEPEKIFNYITEICNRKQTEGVFTMNNISKAGIKQNSEDVNLCFLKKLANKFISNFIY
jgi:hypothetical protein